MWTKRTFPWYQAASERLEWTAWSAVVELALRRLVDAVCDKQTGWLAAEESPHAAVSVSRSDDQRQPYALCMRLAGFERPGRLPALIGAFRRVAYWEFGERDIPWPRKPAARVRNQRRYGTGRRVSRSAPAWQRLIWE